jgi:hypothetical protein
MILAGPHDRLPSWPTAAPAQPAGFPRSSTSRPAPAAYWPPSSPSEPTTPGQVGDRPPCPPTAETGVFSRGCPKLTSSARSSHDQPPDRWDRGERIAQRGRRGALANPGGRSATELICVSQLTNPDGPLAAQIESSLLLLSSGCPGFLWSRLRRWGCACRGAGPYRGGGSREWLVRRAGVRGVSRSRWMQSRSPVALPGLSSQRARRVGRQPAGGRRRRR